MSFKNFITGVVKSYSIIFFSDKIFFSLIVMLVSFLDVFAGLCGLLAVITANLISDLGGYDRIKTAKGYYGFNPLLVGVMMGMTMSYSWTVILLVCISAMMTFFVTIFLEKIFEKYAIPYLSLPFLIVYWILNLSLRDVPLLTFSSREIYLINYFYGVGGNQLLEVYKWWQGLEISHFLRVYFLSLGSIFFQHKLISGILLATGLLYYSRIAFSLSLIGFSAAYLFYPLVGLKVDDMLFSYFGFNYILVSIAVGGYFIIPSKSSYLWTIIIMPVTVLVTIAAIKVFTVFGLMVYSLPFVLIVIVFLMVLHSRIYHKGKLNEVYIQTDSPEENLYNFVNNNHRYKDKVYFSMRLPFYGEWFVSQAHNGQITHKDKWRHAFDFIIRDSEHKTFKGYGTLLEDYYCYNKIVLSPGDGTVEEIADGIADNQIGEINTEANWGNSIIIKHGEGFYSQMSHLRAGSFKVSKGDFVKAGQPVASCGNSGRSPEPHLHIQFQSVPIIGAETLDYPFGYYLKKEAGEIKFVSYNKPLLNDKVMNLDVNPIVKKAFNFSHGDEISFEVSGKGSIETLNWKVITNIHNESYFYCEKTNSFAFFAKDDRMFYFYHFKGNKKSLLYNFFLAAYKVPFGFYQSLLIHDTYALHYTYPKAALFLQDFIAPFYIFMKSNFTLCYAHRDDEMITNYIGLESSAVKKIDGFNTGEKSFRFLLNRNGIQKFEITKGNKKIIAQNKN